MDIVKDTKIVMLPIERLVNNDGQIAGVPKNPRVISDERYRALVRRLKKSNLTGVIPLKVYEQDGVFVVLSGNQRLKALRELKAEEVPCIIVPKDADAETLREIVVLENVNDGEWDGLENWNADELQEWGVTSELGVFGDEEGEDEIQRKLQEFKERIQAGELREDSEEYQEFLEKFKLKKTTDDCYTPELVYNAVAEFVEMRYNLSRVNFVRPFYPGGDYQREKYKKTDVIVDNPPFSILAEILQFFNKNGIRFFLFAPHLTLFSSSSSSSSTALVTGVAITYENGASVNTSFLTNLEPRDIRLMSCPELYAAVRVANEENLKQQKKQLPKYSYDLHVITSASVAPYSRLGIEFVVPVAESVSIDSLDEQKKSGKAIYGKGYLVSDRLFAEREKAEREKAEREKAEREKAERWNLSQREREIVAKLTIASESA